MSYFPMLFTMADWQLKTIANGGYMGNSGATDIVFTSSDEVTKIPHEIEKFTDSTGELKAWVRITTLSCSADTIIYMYYGNAGCADQQDKTGLWNDGGSSYYKGVWHFPNGTSLTANDSTGNGNNGTVSGASATTGPIDGAANFTGTTNSIVTPSTSALNTDIHTISFWFKLNSTSANWTKIMGYQAGGTDRTPGIWVYQAGQNIHWKYDPGNTGTNAIGPNGEGTNFILGQWYYIVGVKNEKAFWFYVNGVEKSGGIIVANPKTSGNAAIEFGYAGYEAPSMNLDEARVASTARSAGWIATEYNNQNSPATFYSVGDTAGVTWTQGTNPSWNNRTGYGCVVYNDKIWIIGGSLSGTGRKNDVWYSSDGTNWTQATAAAGWTARDGLGCVVYDNKIWVMRGNCCKPDVWYSSDGVSWTQATADAGMGGGYLWKNVLVFQNKMWVIGKTNFVNSVYYSTNGVNWTLASAPSWPGRNGQNCLVYDNKMWLIGGSRNAIAPCQSSQTGTLSTDQAYNYSMGYKFTPTIEGRVTGFYGFFNGTKTVRLYDAKHRPNSVYYSDRRWNTVFDTIGSR
ncbi:MAG: DUF2341 domain-containing protein [Candidatus Omnitrophica bacterium]|nr:DUF2341 domain-containing protein [Candidatus Omnitrophota bacterium]